MGDVARHHPAAELSDRAHALDAKPPLPPEVPERHRAQRRVARRGLDRSMAEPILDASRVVADTSPDQ